MNPEGGENATLSFNAGVEERGHGVCGGRLADTRKQLVLWKAGR